MRGFKYILFVLALIVSARARGQYNPSNPAEPGAPVKQYTLTLQADPSGGGSFNLNATSNHIVGETFWVQANTASNFTFVEWTLDDEVVSTTNRFQYTMPAHNVTLIAHYRYTPSNPTEPNEPDIPAKPVYSNIWLTAQPLGGGSFNITSGTSYEVGSSIRVQANPASNFIFVNWTLDGDIISESNVVNHVMLSGKDANRLVANFAYSPGSPGEPQQPMVKKYHRVYLMADPAGGGYFNTESGNQFEEGTRQTFRAYNNQWYTFQNWTHNGEVVSTNSDYTLTIPTEDVTLTAHYTYNYNPGNPGEPGQSTTKHLSVYGMTANGVRNHTVYYPVFLENTEDVYGVTVVVRFPNGFTVNTANIVKAQRAAGHTLTVEALDGNAYRFDLTGNQPMTGQNGKIFDVPLTISSECEPDQSYQISLTNAARINLNGSKEVLNTRNGYIFVEDMREDGLFAQFVYEKLQGRVQFNNLSADKAISYKWDFGDGNSSTEKNPMHIYATTGYYDVTLTVHGKTGSDIAQMPVLINDESTWVVDGTFFLDTEVKGVRYFTSAKDLFAFMAAHPIVGNIIINVKSGTTFDLALSKENFILLTTIQQQLANGGHTLTICKNGMGSIPVLNFGNISSSIDDDMIRLFVDLGKNMICDDVNLKFGGIGFNPSRISAIEEGQTVVSGKRSAEVDFAPVSQDMTFTWTATTDTETATGYQETGKGNIPAMTVTNGSAEDAHIAYNITATYKGKTYFTISHVITLKSSLEGSFVNLTPKNNAQLESTTVKFTWNAISNAVYDVYLWNEANQRPTIPVAEGISELSYVSMNYCQKNRSYKWQVIARNGSQQLASDTMRFTIKILPNLHIYNLHATTSLQAGNKVTIEWTVRNDGDGETGTQNWQDRIWLVPDIYGGTNQNSCKLLASIPNSCSLASGQEYTGQTEVTLDDNLSGSYYLLAAADMSSVNQIEWSSIGGTIVNPYNPVVGGNLEEGTYAHLFAITAADGNQLDEHGETADRSDNFFYTKVEIAGTSVTEGDWLTLKSAYEQMGNGEGWTRPWVFDAESHSMVGLGGVQLRGSRIVGINLSHNNLSGTFPVALLKLPYLETLNLGSNNLEGDIVQAITEFMEENPTLQLAVKTINIANNQLSGNLGLFAEFFPQLESLNASDNMFDEVTPMIAPKVKDLNIGKQKMDKTIVVRLNSLSAESLVSQLPTILLYNHAKQNYSTNINLFCTTKDQSWGLQMTCQNDMLTMPYVTPQNAYMGNSGDVLNVAVIDANRQPEGSSLSMKMEFDEGDANFDGDVDVLDLQTIINYAFEDYKTRPFNYTAANLWIDNVINVQDVVKMTDLLLFVDDVAESRKTQKVQDDDFLRESFASIYMRDGQVWIDTKVPVAAFELTLRNSPQLSLSTQLKDIGFTCRSNSKDHITRIVGYSMTGSRLLPGETAIARIGNVHSTIESAVLSDTKANRIDVSVFAGETTGISEMRNSKWKMDNAIYDLQGRRIKTSTFNSLSSTKKKGLYIQNGKKVVK